MKKNETCMRHPGRHHQPQKVSQSSHHPHPPDGIPMEIIELSRAMSLSENDRLL